MKRRCVRRPMHSDSFQWSCARRLYSGLVVGHPQSISVVKPACGRPALSRISTIFPGSGATYSFNHTKRAENHRRLGPPGQADTSTEARRPAKLFLVAKNEPNLPPGLERHHPILDPRFRTHPLARQDSQCSKRTACRDGNGIGRPWVFLRNPGGRASATSVW